MARNNAKRNRNLVIVESGAKARTIERYLGAGFNVMPSVGHVRDLPPRSLAVDVEHDFEPRYVISADRRDVVERLKKASAGADVYLATDPDREGEAIAWHLAELLGIDPRAKRRVAFNEITESAVKDAFANPRAIDDDLVEAQQARRILDRLVGFKLSPFVRNKVAGGQSAGRVQSVALRLIVDREREIDAFVPVEYWELHVDLAKAGTDATFRGKLVKVPGRKGTANKPTEKQTPLVPDQAVAEMLEQELGTAEYAVSDLERKQVKRSPSKPFITSTLQQSAAGALRYNSTRTMQLAQELYEGIDIGGERVGLITYMRTDSTAMSAQALGEAERFIKRNFGDLYTDGPRRYRSTSRNAQEAHEAIRPTSFSRTPESLRSTLSDQQWRVYELIWKRALASQMTDAVDEQTTVDIDATAPSGTVYGLRVNGTRELFDGHRVLRSRSASDRDDDDAVNLPKLSVGEPLDNRGVEKQQKHTTPPPRYTEAALIRKMEELGIGRPSTYASIVRVIVERQYVERVKGSFVPTKIGCAVCDMLKLWFENLMDTDFTANMETKLDDIASGELERVPMLREFYDDFDAALEHAFKNAERTARAALDDESGLVCEGGEKLVIRQARRGGKFVACPKYPECKFAIDVQPEASTASGEAIENWQGEFQRKMAMCIVAHPDGPPEGFEENPVVPAGVKCEGGTDLIIRRGRNGDFVACPEFPKCRVAMDVKPTDEDELAQWSRKYDRVMAGCVIAHPEAAKQASTKRGRGRGRGGARSGAGRGSARRSRSS